MNDLLDFRKIETMVEILGTGAEAEEGLVVSEGQSLMGSLITQFMAIVRRLLHEMLIFARRFMIYAAEHPLATVLLASNVMIWIS